MRKINFLSLFFISSFSFLSADEISENRYTLEDVINNLIESLNPLLRKQEQNLKSNSLVPNTLQSSKEESFVPEIVFGDIKNAKLKVTIYSAPTCTHCAEYHHQSVAGILALTKTKPLVVVMRTFIANLPWDIVAGKITWVYGVEKQHIIMESLLKDQNIWLIPSAFNKHNDAEKKTYIEKLDQDLENAAKLLNISKKVIKDKLDIKDDDVTGLLKIYALTHLNIPLAKLEEVLKNKELEHHLLRMTLNAKDDQGKLLNFTPAIYVQKHPKDTKDQGYLQKDNLMIDQILKLLKEAEKGE